MSVLSFPRLYFRGFTSWNPCTFNNNDFSSFPTYDAANAALNWDFLSQFGIAPDNVRDTFRPWAIKLQPDKEQEGGNTVVQQVVPAEWNMFGSHAVDWVQYQDKTTTIQGGTYGYQKPASASDPVIGTPVSIFGDSQYSSAKLVDVNPVSFWCSQVYFAGMKIGSDACGFSGPRIQKMHSRWVNLQRIYDPTSNYAQPAASVAACFQTCFDKPTFVNSGNSQLIDALQTAAGKARGVMVRWTAYVNLYFQNGIFNDISPAPRSYEELSQALKEAFDTWYEDPSQTSQFFAQPCYSHTVGSIGVWEDDELISVPCGRYLAAQEPVAPIAGGDATTLGPAAAAVDLDAGLVSLDLNSTMPEAPSTTSPPTSNLDKEVFGPLSLGALVDGEFKGIKDLPADSYAKAAYEASAGIVDVPLDLTSEAGKALQNGTGLLAVQFGGKTALAEQGGGYSAQTDERGIYLDEGDATQFKVNVYKSGVPAPGTRVLVAKFDAGLSLVDAGASAQYVGFTNGEQQVIDADGTKTRVTIVTVDADGVATVGINALEPGFPVLTFYPYPDGAAQPVPPTSLGSAPNAKDGITDAFYTAVRVLPFDNAMPQAFIDLWNKTQDPDQAWTFVYEHVLCVYDMLFNFMLTQVDLGNRQAVHQNAKYIQAAIMPQLVPEGTNAMPVTRDMSRGARFTLLIWLYLDQHGYELDELSPEVLKQIHAEL